MIFLDTIERANPTPDDGQLECTNPCGEVPLLPYESCNLGSINLKHFVAEYNGERSVDWERLKALVAAAVRLLDDTITVNRFPVHEIQHATLASRKIGLGVMGFAEMCILLGIPYSSKEVLGFAGELMRFIAHEARSASARLAEERGVFPNWTRSIWAKKGLRLRNATQISIAPTGTISIIGDTSSGIEPLFAIAYRRRNVLDNQTLCEFNPILVRYLDRHGLSSRELLDSIAEHGGLVEGMKVPNETRWLFQTALQITPEQHVKVQAAFQAHVDNAVSKTVNLPENATPADIANVYRLAYTLGCKGITVFRYGSRSTQVFELGINEAPYELDHFVKCDPGACRL
jgi:ribonucleoside-diphosphate reductase alpha chain